MSSAISPVSSASPSASTSETTGNSDIRRVPSPLHPTPQHTYSAGIPAPPRILIPPHLAPPPGGSFPISGPFAEVYNAAYPSNPVLSVFLGTPTDAQRWTYECRRQAQQVLPWVWLGSMTAARDTDLLAKRGITLLIAVRSSMAAKGKFLSGAPGATVDQTSQTPLRHAPGGVGRPAYVTLDLSSTPGAPLIPTFRSAAQLIDRNYLSTIISPEQLAEIDNSSETPDYHSLVQEHYSQYSCTPSQNSTPALEEALNPFPPGITRPGSTLVLCETGNEKSAVVVASYIMQHFESTLVQAVQVVQGRRFSVGFDDNLKYALAAWEPIYKSYRDVHQARKQQQQQQQQHHQQPPQGHQRQEHSVHGAGGKKKRGYEEVRNQTNDDEDMIISSQDAIAIDGRSGMAPFLDDARDKNGTSSDDIGMDDVDVRSPETFGGLVQH